MTEEEIPLTDVDIIVSQSDLKGFIIYANPIFYKISDYPNGKLIGENHNIVRHKDMPKVIFKYMWEQIESKKEVYCFIKNKVKGNRYYWVYAYVRPSLNKDGTIRNYISTRKAISKKAKSIIEPLYKHLLNIEKEYGLEESEKEFNKFMKNNCYQNKSYNDIIHSIQY